MPKYDPIIASDIMNMVGMGGEKLQIAYIYDRVTDIIDYFSRYPDYRYQILKVLSSKLAVKIQNNSQGDKLDALWSYVQLCREKEKQLKQLDPQDFEQDIVADIAQGHIPLEKKRRIADDLERQKLLLERKSHVIDMQSSAKDNIIERLSKNKLDLYAGTLKELDNIDLQLNNFN